MKVYRIKFAAWDSIAQYQSFERIVKAKSIEHAIYKLYESFSAIRIVSTDLIES